MRNGIFRAIVQIIACANPAAMVTCAPAAVGLTLAAGGSIKDALIAGALAFAQLPQGLDVWGAVGNFVGAAATSAGSHFLLTVATHAVVSGAISMAQGGSFLSGAASGAVGALGSALGATFGADEFSRVAISAVAGGTASVVAGGKFANGAITAAFATMYNDVAHEGMRGTQSGETEYSHRIDDVGLGHPDLAFIGQDGCTDLSCAVMGVFESAITLVPGAGPELRGGIVAANGTRILGFTEHGVDRAVGGYKRSGTTPSAILDALKDPIRAINSGIDSLGRPFEIFVGRDARVIVNPETNRIVSVNPRTGRGASK